MQFVKIKTTFLICFILSSCSHTKGVNRFPSNKLEDEKISIYMTAKDSNFRLTQVEKSFFKPKEQPFETETVIFVDPDKQFQTILGIGGAITDSAAETLAKLPLEKQEQVIKDYYDPIEGIGYSLARTHINSCDFSSENYTYIKEGDASLSTFDIGHDKKFRIPLIKKAIERAQGNLTMFVSPWSPPAFMKDNNNLLQGGKLKKEFYPSWALYYTKFIKAYKAEGIPIWGITIQNEPMAKQKWESCIYTAEEEKNFLKDYLGPTMKNEGLGETKIIGWDHNRDLLYQRTDALLSDPVASDYLWGIGFHWYENWSGGTTMHDNLKLAKDAYPDKNFLFTEGTVENFDAKKMGSWDLGERYGKNMIADFNNGSAGFTDWNIVLDENGGPNHVKNYCFAPIHGNTKTGELTYTNTFYYIGHFSKFVKPGAKRIVSSASRSQLLTTAFKNLDNSIAVIIMNPSDQKSNFHLWIHGQAAEMTAPAHSILTAVF